MNPMKWYWTVAGGHTHVRVFMNGAKCGDLCFRNEEFQWIHRHSPEILFIEDSVITGLTTDERQEWLRKHESEVVR
jgi:hypothetical protein